MRGSSAIHGALDCGLYLDGLDTDGRSTWSVRATAEIKAAKGAGSFKVTLEVTDNAAGEAMSAAWTLEKADKPSKAQDDEHEVATKLSEILHTLRDASFRGVESMGVDKFKGGRELKKAALTLGRQRGLVVEHHEGGAARGWRITDTGRKFIAGPATAPKP